MEKAVVEKRLLPDHPGYAGYQITASTAEAVQAEITKIMNGPNVAASEFYNPFRLDEGKYWSQGYVLSKIFSVT